MDRKMPRHGQVMGLMDRIRDSLWIAQRAETPPEQPAPGAGVQPPARTALSRLATPTEALTLSTVYRAIDILATAASQLSIGVWRAGQEIDTPSLITKPDVEQPASAFLELTTTSLAATGEGFWRRHRVGPADPVVSLEVMPAHEVSVRRDRHGRLEYGWRGETLQPWQVSHLKKLRVPGRLRGLGPIEAAAAELRGALDLRDYASSWFTDSGIPNGVLSTEQTLSPAQAEQWKARARDMFKPTEPTVLGNGLTYSTVGLRPADAQFLESRQFSVTEVARLFGIPPTYLAAAVDGGSDTYSNQEQVDIWFVRYTLMSYLREIEVQLTELLPRGQVARFKVDALLRTDTKTRYEAHEIAIRTGLYSAQHAQQIEGLPHTAPTPAPAPAPTLEQEPTP